MKIIREYSGRIIPFGFSKGGLVSGAGSSTSDSIHKMLSDGEFVINAEAVERIGVRKLDVMNRSIPSVMQSRSGAESRFHLTTDTPLVVGSKFGFLFELPGKCDLQVEGVILKTGRNEAKRGSDCSITRHLYSPAPQVPEPKVLRVNDDPAPHGTTPRELVMVAMHLKGWVNKEIAKALGVGIHWVKNCTRAVYDKIPGDAVRTQIELLLYDDIDGGALRRAADFQFDKWARGR